MTRATGAATSIALFWHEKNVFIPIQMPYFINQHSPLPETRKSTNVVLCILQRFRLQARCYRMSEMCWIYYYFSLFEPEYQRLNYIICYSSLEINK